MTVWVTCWPDTVTTRVLTTGTGTGAFVCEDELDVELEDDVDSGVVEVVGGGVCEVYSVSNMSDRQWGSASPRLKRVCMYGGPSVTANEDRALIRELQ